MINQAGFGRRGRISEPPRRVFRTEVASPVEVVITRRGPGMWKIAGYLLVTLLVLGVIGHIIDPDKKSPGGVQVAAAAPAKPSAPTKCGATLKEFSALQIGTSPERAASIIG